MLDLTVIILVGKEERHIRRCLEKLAPLAPRRIVVVESQHGDRTHEIAVETGAETVFHDWPGTQARQFNWALDNLGIDTEWILRLDADEYLTDDGIVWLQANLGSVPANPGPVPSNSVQANLGSVPANLGPVPSNSANLGPVPSNSVPSNSGSVPSNSGSVPSNSGSVPADCDALEFTLERKFRGGVIRHGTNGIGMVRMFRRGRGRYSEAAMDERIVVGEGGEGRVMSVPVTFYDDSLMPMREWRAKHRGYAKREAAQALASLRTGVWTDPRKATYYRLPRYLRAFAYFAIRYLLKGGFLDGRAGFLWNFWQGLWYRLLVDREIAHVPPA